VFGVKILIVDVFAIFINGKHVACKPNL